MTELPLAIQCLWKIKNLDFNNNRLSSLPDSFFSLKDDCEIYLQNNPFDALFIENSREREITNLSLILFFSTYEEPLSSYTFREVLESLQEDSESIEKLFFNFEEKELKILTTFFLYLQRSSTYRDPYKKFTAKFLIKCLNLAKENNEFKSILFANLEEASGSCGDRVSLSLNNLFFQYCLATKTWPKGFEITDFIIGSKRLELLEKEARSFVENYRGDIDDIEVYLILQVKLRKALKLPVYSEEMLYPNLATLDTEQIEEIGAKVLSKTMDAETTLMQSDLWIDHIKKSNQEEYQRITDSFECPDSSEDETDADYKGKIDKITNDRKEAIDNFIKEKTKDFLKKKHIIKQS